MLLNSLTEYRNSENRTLRYDDAIYYDRLARWGTEDEQFLDGYFNTIGTAASKRNLSANSEKMIKLELTNKIGAMINASDTKIRALNRLAKPWVRTQEQAPSLLDLQKQRDVLQQQVSEVQAKLKELQ